MEDMFKIKTRRGRIRALSFTATALTVAIIFAIVGMTAAFRLRMSTEYSYRRALSELSAHVDSIDLALQKSGYAGTSAELVGLCAQIWSDSAAAKTDISQMPLSDIDLGRAKHHRRRQKNDKHSHGGREKAVGGAVRSTNAAAERRNDAFQIRLRHARL